MHVPPYAFASGFGATDPDRRRKLLLHRRQIDELGRRTTQDSLTLVPLSVYFKDGRAKVDLALARGRKRYDKRHALAARDADLEARRAFRSQAAYPGRMNDTVRLGRHRRRAGWGSTGASWSWWPSSRASWPPTASRSRPRATPGRRTRWPARSPRVVLLFGVLLHELGHAVVARRFRPAGRRHHPVVDGRRDPHRGRRPVARRRARHRRRRTARQRWPSAACSGRCGSLVEARGRRPPGRVRPRRGWRSSTWCWPCSTCCPPPRSTAAGSCTPSSGPSTRDRWRATRIATSAGVWLGGGHGRARLPRAGAGAATRSTASSSASSAGGCSARPGRSGSWAGSASRSTACGSPRSCDRSGAAPGWITVRAFAERYASGRPGWVWLLERWDGGYGGVLLGDAVGAVPFPQWDLARPARCGRAHQRRHRGGPGRGCPRGPRPAPAPIR